MRSQKLRFENAQGQKLVAYLDLPANGEPLAYSLFAHCFTCTKNLKAVGHISRALTRRAIAVLRFDFTGLGESEGDFADTNFSSNVDDLVAAGIFMEREFQAPSLLIGHSLGGPAAILAASHITSCRAVATIAAPSDPAHVAHLLAGSRERIEREGEAEVMLAGRRFRIKKQFLDDLQEARVHDVVRNLDRALLILHSPVDATVDIRHAARLYEAARHPKSFISLNRADHLLSREEDSRYVGNVIAAWASNYMVLAQRKHKAPKHGDGYVAVNTGRDHFYTEINANGHTLTADEPASLGGGGQGPSPYELLAAALGACTGITLRMYADHKGWPLEEINVWLKHEKVHSTDCEDCEKKQGKIDRIEREIELLGALTDDQRQRLLEIADKCPVHRTLHDTVVVTTSLKP